MSDQPFYTIQLLEKTMLTSDIMILSFSKPSGFSYTAGQFVQFQFTHEGQVYLRSYSLACVPAHPVLEFCVKIVPGGKASQYFVKLAVGDSATVSAAKGAFVCQASHCTQKVFIATGAGIAPIVAMVENQLNTNDTVELVFGVRNETDVFWVDKFQGFKDHNKRFAYSITLSKPTAHWRGLAGRVTAHIPKHDVPADYYMCGSVEMVKDVRKILMDGGVSTKSIHFEIF